MSEIRVLRMMWQYSEGGCRVVQGSEMSGALLVPSSSPTLSPIYDGLGVNVTSNVTWCHLNYGMFSRRIYKLSFYGERSITLPCSPVMSVF